MPIVDGHGATKLIREHEESRQSARKIPVFAVSASLIERDKQMYIDSGFDGWIMKPIDFQRLNHLLSGVYMNDIRNGDDSIYMPGKWEQGGWFGDITKL